MNEYQKGALEELIDHQTQLDADGIRVGVSREALDVMLAWIDSVGNYFNMEKFDAT